MAKVPYSKLKCKTNEEISIITIDDIEIEIKQYLPIQEKLSLIGRVIELAHDQDYNFSNPVKANVIRDLEMVYAYTNINFTEKQKEDMAKLYDQLYSSGVLTQILQAIPSLELNEICVGIRESIDSVYKYQNSVLGIMDAIKNDYELQSNLLEKAKDLIKENPEEFSFLRDVLTKMN